MLLSFLNSQLVIAAGPALRFCICSHSMQQGLQKVLTIVVYIGQLQDS